jgi:UDP-glucuronate decarboxylase
MGCEGIQNFAGKVSGVRGLGMKILLTGAAGFLGSHLTEKLLNEGHVVLGIDDLSTGNLKNLEKFRRHVNFSFVQHDVREPFICEVDSILNFACPASPIQYQADPVRTIETNFLGAINMLHLARRTGAKIVQASTSEVYGDPDVSPQNETYWGNVNPIGIRSCYDEGKRAAETLCFDYKRQYGVDARVIRIFNTYGPNMAEGDGRVVSNFIVQALQGSDITIYGDGSQTRSFCFVTDLVEGIYRALTHSSQFSSPVNLGNPAEFSIIELAEKVLKATKSKSKLIFVDLPMDDPRQRRPDITLAKKVLGWEPKVDLEQGIQLTIDYFSKGASY